MRKLTLYGICNHCSALGNMIRAELKQEEKHKQNPKCKPADWVNIAGYIEYAFGIEKPTEEEIIKIAHFYNW